MEAVDNENAETEAVASQDSLADTKIVGELEISTKVVEPTYGLEIAKNTIIAVIVALVCMVIYISLRFKSLGGMKSAVTAIIGLVHNVLIVTAVYIVFKITINSAFIAAILTIVGYSINNTIVLLDTTQNV